MKDAKWVKDFGGNKQKLKNGTEIVYPPAKISYVVSVPESFDDAAKIVGHSIDKDGKSLNGVWNYYMAHFAVMANSAALSEYRSCIKKGKSVEAATAQAVSFMRGWTPSVGERVSLDDSAKVRKHAANLDQDDFIGTLKSLGVSDKAAKEAWAKREANVA